MSLVASRCLFAFLRWSNVSPTGGWGVHLRPTALVSPSGAWAPLGLVCCGPMAGGCRSRIRWGVHFPLLATRRLAGRQVARSGQPVAWGSGFSEDLAAGGECGGVLTHAGNCCAGFHGREVHRKIRAQGRILGMALGRLHTCLEPCMCLGPRVRSAGASCLRASCTIGVGTSSMGGRCSPCV